MPTSSPVASARPVVKMFLDVVGADIEAQDVGNTCSEFDWKATVNGGYMIRAKLVDANFNVLKKYLVEFKYFKQARATVFRCRFRLLWPDTGNQTPWQIAYMVSMHAEGADSDRAVLRFTGIDPPSWYLNCGDASGGVYSGRVSDVIRAVVNDYAPGIALDVTRTTDSGAGQFWMMRQDPKTFILSLLDWSCSLTPKKTQWFVGVDGVSLSIKEQAEMPSRNVGFYRGPNRTGRDPHIQNWEVLTNNALSLMNTKLVTGGISAVSGQYLDRVTDVAEQKVFVKDSRTPNKYKARTTQEKAFSKPPDGGPGRVGWTAVAAVPEVYSGGEIGKTYEQYIDGRARAIWLNMANIVQRARFSVIGHGVYYNCNGLGVDTITIEWLDIDGRPFFLSGNWIIYGYWHKFSAGKWVTHLYCARLDYDSTAVAVPSTDFEPGM